MFIVCIVLFLKLCKFLDQFVSTLPIRIADRRWRIWNVQEREEASGREGERLGISTQFYVYVGNILYNFLKKNYLLSCITLKIIINHNKRLVLLVVGKVDENVNSHNQCTFVY